MTSTTLTTTALLNELVIRGVISENDSQKFAKRAAAAEAKAAKAAHVETVANRILGFIGEATGYFTVKTTANSEGVMGAAEADRSTTLKALSSLVADGRLVKVGLKGGEEKPVAEVNAFQIRYRLPVVATEEVVEEAK